VNMSEISLVPKVAFIEIAPLSPNERMVYNWYGVYIPIVNGHESHYFHFHLENKTHHLDD
jgi:hypothetical protein